MNNDTKEWVNFKRTWIFDFALLTGMAPFSKTALALLIYLETCGMRFLLWYFRTCNDLFDLQERRKQRDSELSAAVLIQSYYRRYKQVCSWFEFCLYHIEVFEVLKWIVFAKVKQDIHIFQGRVGWRVLVYFGLLSILYSYNLSMDAQSIL